MKNNESSDKRDKPKEPLPSPSTRPPSLVLSTSGDAKLTQLKSLLGTSTNTTTFQPIPEDEGDEEEEEVEIRKSTDQKSKKKKKFKKKIVSIQDTVEPKR